MNSTVLIRESHAKAMAEHAEHQRRFDENPIGENANAEASMSLGRLSYALGLEFAVLAMGDYTLERELNASRNKTIDATHQHRASLLAGRAA